MAGPDQLAAILSLDAGELAASEQDVVDYVLHAPRAEEQRAIDEALERGYDAWPLIAASDMEAAMLRLHTKTGDKPRPNASPKP